MVVVFLPRLWQSLIAHMAQCLHARSAARLIRLLQGILFAQGLRRTVTAWLRAANVTEDFADYYYFLNSLGQRHTAPAGLLLRRALEILPAHEPICFAIDDTPTPRYGPRVQGAGTHRHPSPGPADSAYLFGHLWVTLSLIGRHPQCGPTGLPIRALLYVRQKDMAALPRGTNWIFRTKLELAAELIRWAAEWSRSLGRPIRVVVDGAYAKKPFLKAAAEAGVGVVSRLRRDAALRSLPAARRAGQRGRPRIYGEEVISLRQRARQSDGWRRVEVWQYGALRRKRVQWIEATWRPASGRIRVALVRERSGWVAFFSTDPTLDAEAILRLAAERMVIEQNYHDLKEVEGLGQVQLRKIYANVGAVQATLWAFTLVELWAWDQPVEVLRDRGDSPWDDPQRRPSHADKRRALQRQCWAGEYQRLGEGQPIREEIQQFIERLIKRAA